MTLTDTCPMPPRDGERYSLATGSERPRLIVWAYSHCRSTLATFLALRTRLECDIRLVLCGPRCDGTEDEISDVAALPPDMADLIDPDHDTALAYLEEHKGDAHLFGFYHPASRHAALPRHCAAQGIAFAIASEAPCNMETRLLRRTAKQAYYRWILPSRVRPVVEQAHFFANLSGVTPRVVETLGWRSEQVFPFGYFPPPLPGSRFRQREARPPRPLTLLLSGGHTAHRDPMTLLRALDRLLSAKDKVRAIICGAGPLTGAMQAYARRRSLPVEFLGMVPLPELVRLYESVDLFVATGAREPWGIRVNDAINCGCPVLASRGMGASAIIEQFGCGAVFPPGDDQALARLIENSRTEECWRAMVEAVAPAADHIAPSTAAKHLAALVDRFLMNGAPLPSGPRA
jgi:glycosyltransferase involved in cell wall biosynthesis